jgi:hypothetical protein
MADNTADGIRGVWYLLVPCIGLCFFFAVLLVKRIPLKRADDAKRKEEAKQWMNDRKEKHKRRKGSSGKDDVEMGPDADHRLAGDGYGAGSEEKGDELEAQRTSDRSGSEETVLGDEPLSTRADRDGQSKKHHKLKELEHELEEAGRGAEEAFGAGIPRSEGLEQGPVGADTRKADV